MRRTNWSGIQTLAAKTFNCGFCGGNISADRGYGGDDMNHARKSFALIYICHNCHSPTFFDYDFQQTPGPRIGNKVNHITDPVVEQLFDEAKSCFSISAFTSTVMCCRKLLMNISVSEGAKEGLNFVQYVTHLETNNYIPPNGRKWVDSIRKLGNEANHSIEFRSEAEASRILIFTEMLLRFIYELPGIMNDHNS